MKSITSSFLLFNNLNCKKTNECDYLQIDFCFIYRHVNATTKAKTTPKMVKVTNTQQHLTNTTFMNISYLDMSDNITNSVTLYTHQKQTNLTYLKQQYESDI